MEQITSPGEVRAVLNSADFLVPPVPDAGPPPGIAWLRASVSRFSNGPDHLRRRALGTGALAKVVPATLHRDAFEQTTAVLSEAGEQPIDLIARVARPVPVLVLARALGIETDAATVAEVAHAYHPHVEATAAADLAVSDLVAACGGTADETTAARICLLVQACDATTGLVGNALAAELTGYPDLGVNALLDRTLRAEPPILSTRRVARTRTRVAGTEIPAGTVVRLDLTQGENPDGDDLAFGAGPRSCPGRDHALAIATGILEATRGCHLADPDRPIAYEQAANLRVPAALIVKTR
ncbi:hypothetical protein [Actinomadura roseirufa]|uniref:hypothetical protein n=1 Tax=Actinomadura roseirufa TaxID=2094049 RepID=UPI001A956074|nr:hypothetical protein [Actinomadura roseirufa]